MTSKMMIPDNPNLIEHTAQEFWALAGAPGGAGETGETGELPCDIRTTITLALPLEVSPVPALRVSHIFDWTRRTGGAHRIRGRDRRLHGCLLADRGKGTIFVDASDYREEIVEGTRNESDVSAGASVRDDGKRTTS